MAENNTIDFPLVVVQQDELFDESQLPAGRELLLPIDVQQKRFTAEFVARNQEKYHAIVSALAEGLGVRQIARAFRVSHHTVATIREREAKLVATQKEQVGRKLMRITTMAVERLEEALENDELAPGQLPVTVGILVDKSLVWSGQATQTIAVRHELAQDELKKLFSKIIDVPGQVIDPKKGELGPALDSVSGNSEGNGQ